LPSLVALVVVPPPRFAPPPRAALPFLTVVPLLAAFLAPPAWAPIRAFRARLDFEAVIASFASGDFTAGAGAHGPRMLNATGT